MKILLANFSLEHLAGSETWTMTMFDYLNKKHEVDIYVSTGGKNLLLGNYASSAKEYDVALINHNICLHELREWKIGRRIFTSHGVIPLLEQPRPGADAYVAVSEEVQANLKSLGFDSVVLRNPINTECFFESPVHEQLRNILWMNNRAPTLELIRPACEGYEFRVQTGWKDGVQEAMQWADLVVSSGRGIYEALSCGRNAMVVNYCGCDGMVTEETILELRKNNCSGRRYGEMWSPQRMREEFLKYDANRNMRGYIIENNNVEIIAEKYLSL